MDTPHPDSHLTEVDPEQPPATLWHSLGSETRARLLVFAAGLMVLANPPAATAVWAYSGHRIYLAVIQAVLTAGAAFACCTLANRLTHDDGGIAASGIIASFAVIEIAAFIFLQLFALAH